MNAQHAHTYTRRNKASTIETCSCGKFRHTENNKNPIIKEMKTANETLKEMEYTIQILELTSLDLKGEISQSDLQGAIQAVIMNAIAYGKGLK